MSNKPIFLAALIGATLVQVEVARAAEGSKRRLNNLHNDVAVRHRRLLVANRFEFAPLFESTINPDYQHILGVGAKLEYHLGDMLSIGVVGSVSPGPLQFNTKLTDRIIESPLEPSPDDMTREPSREEFTSRLNKMPVHGAAYLSITPWYGKLAAFSAAFVAFDFYFQAGVSYAQLESDCPPSICDDPSPGMPRPGPGGETIPADLNLNNDPPLNAGTHRALPRRRHPRVLERLPRA